MASAPAEPGGLPCRKAESSFTSAWRVQGRQQSFHLDWSGLPHLALFSHLIPIRGKKVLEVFCALRGPALITLPQRSATCRNTTVAHTGQHSRFMGMRTTMGRVAAGLVLLGLGKEGGTRNALHRDAQRPSSPQPLVAGTLRHGPRRHLAQFQSWCTPRRQVYVKRRAGGRQRGCQTHKINCLLICCCSSKILYI